MTITLRQIGRTERRRPSCSGSPASRWPRPACSCPFTARRTTARTWAILVALGLFGGLGQLFLTSSLRFAPVPVVVPFDYTQLLWAVLLGWLLWDTHPPASTWAGAAVIVAQRPLHPLPRAQARQRRSRAQPARPSRSSKGDSHCDCPLLPSARPISRRAMSPATRAGLRPVAALSCQIVVEPARDRLDPAADHVLVAVPRDIRSRR